MKHDIRNEFKVMSLSLLFMSTGIGTVLFFYLSTIFRFETEVVLYLEIMASLVVCIFPACICITSSSENVVTLKVTAQT